MADDITKFLEEKKQDIDDIIRKYVPENFSQEYMEQMIGRARYKYDLETINKAITEPIWDFLSRGGKRFRPALFMLVAEALGGDLEKIKDFAAVIELAHEGSIMADDVEDNGELRRGKPCTHKIYGVDIAVNASSTMYFLPMLVFINNRDKIDDKTMLKAYEIFSKEMINIHFGQGMDIWWHKGKVQALTEEHYLQMCVYKTGCLTRMASKMAAVLSGASDEQVEKLGNFAEAVGVGFQIQDDILSASGEEFQKKKGYGDDITEGKRTLMVIHTLNKANEDDRQRLLEILDMHTRDPKLIDDAIALLKKYGAIEYARQFARKIVNDAWQETESLLPETDAKKKLKSLVDFLIERKI